MTGLDRYYSFGVKENWLRVYFDYEGSANFWNTDVDGVIPNKKNDAFLNFVKDAGLVYHRQNRCGYLYNQRIPPLGRNALLPFERRGAQFADRYGAGHLQYFGDCKEANRSSRHGRRHTRSLGSYRRTQILPPIFMRTKRSWLGFTAGFRSRRRSSEAMWPSAASCRTAMM